MPAPTGIKLRDSCESCAASKVRCSKGKPCTRCAERGTECLYQVTRRTGRKFRNRSHDATTSTSMAAESDFVPLPDQSNASEGIPFTNGFLSGEQGFDSFSDTNSEDASLFDWLANPQMQVANPQPFMEASGSEHHSTGSLYSYASSSRNCGDPGQESSHFPLSSDSTADSIMPTPSASPLGAGHASDPFPSQDFGQHSLSDMLDATISIAGKASEGSYPQNGHQSPYHHQQAPCFDLHTKLAIESMLQSCHDRRSRDLLASMVQKLVSASSNGNSNVYAADPHSRRSSISTGPGSSHGPSTCCSPLDLRPCPEASQAAMGRSILHELQEVQSTLRDIRSRLPQSNPHCHGGVSLADLQQLDLAVERRLNSM